MQGRGRARRRGGGRGGVAHRLAVLGGVGCVLKRRASFGSTEQSTRSGFAVDLFYYPPERWQQVGAR